MRRGNGERIMGRKCVKEDPANGARARGALRSGSPPGAADSPETEFDGFCGA